MQGFCGSEATDMLDLSRKDTCIAKKLLLGRQTQINSQLAPKKTSTPNFRSLKLLDYTQRYGSFSIHPHGSVTQNGRHKSQGAEDHLNVAILVILFSLQC